MTNQVTCPGCGAVSHPPRETAAEQVRCRQCNAVFQIPAVRDVPNLLQAQFDSSSHPNVPPVRRPVGLSGLLLAGLVFGGLLCVGLGYGAAKLWFLPRPGGQVASKSEDDKASDKGRNKENDDTKDDAKKDSNKKDDDKKTEVKKAEDRKDDDKGDPKGDVPGIDPLQSIKPLALDKDRVERPLPGTIKDVSVGGAGRFLVLHLADKRQLALFDVNEGKVTRYLPVAADRVHFAAGLDKLIVVLPDNNTLQRWDLHTGKREASTTLPFQGVVKAVALGSASQGPVLVHWAVNTNALANAPVDFLDLQTLKPLDLLRPADSDRAYRFRDAMHFRASADGTVFGVWATSHSPQGIGSLLLVGNTIQTHYEHDSAGHVVPGPDGQHLYTAGRIFSNQVKRVGDGRNAGSHYLPAHHGLAYVGFSPGDRLARRDPDTPPVKGLRVFLSGNDRPVVTLSDVEVPGGRDTRAVADFTQDKRLHLIPAAKLLITIPTTNDKLVLHRFDLEASLDKAAIDYLFVTSQPPAQVAKNQPFRYQVVVKSKQGGLRFRLESGPPNMTVSAAGLLTWNNPDAAAEVPIVLAIADKTGQEIFHTFKLRIE